MKVWAALACLLAVLGLAAQSAHADSGDPSKFGFEKTETGRIGSSDAGAHPTVWTQFSFKSTVDHQGLTIPHGSPATVSVDMPMGLVGNPAAMPKCKRMEFIMNVCPPQTQVGVANPWPAGFPARFPDRPIYVLETDGTGPAVLGIDVIGYVKNNAYLRVYVKPDGGLRTVTDPLPRGTALIENKLTLWGIPADENKCNPSHPDYDPGAVSPYAGLIPAPCPKTDADDWERKAFMTSPTDCSQIPFSILRGTTFKGQETVHRATQAHAPENCDSLVFEPTFKATPTNPSADGVSGLHVELGIPQNEDPDGRATPRLLNADVTLPEGVSINPGAAPGLEACLDRDFQKGAEAPVRCQQAAKVGRVTITSPVLDEPLPGDIFIGEPVPGNRYRIFIHAAGQGVTVKLAGSLRPDPRTGQITAQFRDNPPLPFSHMALEFRGGARGVLAMPQTCGPKATKAVLTPNSGQPPVTLESTFQMTNCPAGHAFGPSFAAGMARSAAGAHAPFSASFGKPDTHQSIGGVNVQLPQGLLAKVRDVPLCSDADANAGTCPAASRVGTATTGSGAGPNPLFLDGGVFLTGGYKGGAYGLAIQVRAIAGPYDLGWVVVRQAIHVDPNDAKIKVVSDPLPTIVEGVPLRLQRIDVKMDRPDFTLNPTSCEPKTIQALLTSEHGAAVALDAPFQASGCSSLPVRPRMALELVGRNQTTDGKHPGLRALVTQQSGESGLRKVAVRLPLSLALEDENAQALCEFADGMKDEPTCPRGSIIGRATAVSPVLKAPLSGPVYFVKNVRRNRAGRLIRTMPMLVVALRGEVALNLRAISDADDEHLVSTFSMIPDAPISAFNLNIDGGANGILAANTDICAEPQTADAEVDGQNGRGTDLRVQLKLPCPLEVLGREVAGRTVKVRVGGLKPGRLTVSGAGLRQATRTVKAGQQFLTVSSRLTASGRRAVRRRQALKVDLRLAPTGGKVQRATSRARASAKKAKVRAARN